MEPIVIDGETLSLTALARLLHDKAIKVKIAPDALERVEASRKVVEAALHAGAPVYGVNTGFGRLAEKRISADQLRDLQRNLIRSHLAGVGVPLSPLETRMLMVLRANALAKGNSGVRPETLEALVALINHDVLPVVPEKGSVGASGDLAPLAHLAAVLIGEGRAVYKGIERPGHEALDRAGLKPITLEAKEGLSLVNGTQLMLAIGAKVAIETRMLLRQLDVIAALTIDALMGTDVAFDERIHAVRPHAGQKASAKNLRRLLAGSAIRESHRGPHCKKVQDPYSMRCVPQVHGAARDAHFYVAKILEVEVNSATDNPLVFTDRSGENDPKKGEILSGGNFHGAPLALAFDVLAIAVAQLGAISERRIERLVNPDYSGLPPFLSRAEPGLHSGFMMAQVTAAALVNENKVLAHPASVDSIPTSAGFEDHVSMGVNAVRKGRAVLRNTQTVAAIELLTSVQAVEFHAPLHTSPPLEAVREGLREFIPQLVEDRALSPDIEKALALIRDNEILRDAEQALGESLD